MSFLDSRRLQCPQAIPNQKASYSLPPPIGINGKMMHIAAPAVMTGK